MTNKSLGKFFLQSSLLLILLSFLVYLTTMYGSPLVVEVTGLVILLLLSVVGLAAYNNYGSKIVFCVFPLYILNLLFLWYFYNWQLYPALLLVSLFGFLVSLPSRPGRKGEENACEPSAMASTPPPQKVGEAPKVEPKLVSSKESVVLPAKAKFIPGKYVASKRSNVYHEPKCDWAKKIQKARQVWFASREEALNKGYKKHGCVQ